MSAGSVPQGIIRRCTPEIQSTILEPPAPRPDASLLLAGPSQITSFFPERKGFLEMRSLVSPLGNHQDLGPISTAEDFGLNLPIRYIFTHVPFDRPSPLRALIQLLAT